MRGSGTHSSVNSVGTSTSLAWLSIGSPRHAQSRNDCGSRFCIPVLSVSSEINASSTFGKITGSSRAISGANGSSIVIAASTPPLEHRLQYARHDLANLPKPGYLRQHLKRALDRLERRVQL